MSTPTTHLVLSLAGQNLPVLAHLVKGRDDGRIWHAFALPGKAPRLYGEQIPALDVTLPSSVTLDGEHIALSASVTEDGRERRSFRGTRLLPSLGERAVNVVISQTKAGLWNVKVTVTQVARQNAAARLESAQARSVEALRELLAVV